MTTIAHPETTEVANHLIGQGDNVLTAELVHPEELMSGLLSQVWRLLCCLAHHPLPCPSPNTCCLIHYFLPPQYPLLSLSVFSLLLALSTCILLIPLTAALLLLLLLLAS